MVSITARAYPVGCLVGLVARIRAGERPLRPAGVRGMDWCVVRVLRFGADVVRVRVGLIGCLAVVALAGLAGQAWGSSYTAYVINRADETVTPIWTATNTTGDPISVGHFPVGVAITPNGRTAYVTSESGVTPITIATNTAGSPIPVTGEGLIAITPNGKTAYVTNANSINGAVTPINLATNTPGSAIPVGRGPTAIAITPDGKTAYVGNASDDTLTPINLATNNAGSPIPVGGPPTAIAITPDGKTAYVLTNANSVIPIAIATNAPETPIVLGGAFLLGLAITPNGNTVYVTHAGAPGGVTPISIATNTPGSTIPVELADEIAITPDGATAYVTTGDSAIVTPISVATNTPGSAIAVGHFPTGIAITPTARRLSSTSVTCSPASVQVEQSTSCSATVTDSDSGTPVTPTGKVSFTTDSSGSFAGNPCTLSRSGGTASCQVTYTLTAAGSGQHTLTANYVGDRAHVGGTGQAIVPVAGRATSTTISCAPPSVLVQQPTTCTATVTDSDSGTPITPSGSVGFAASKSGKFGASSCPLSGSGSVASCQVSYAPSAFGNGQQTIAATYSGDSAHAGSSGQMTLVVQARSTGTTIGCQEAALTVGQSTLCTATVTDTAPGPAITPTGTVKFAGSATDSIVGSPCSLSGSAGVASCQVSYTPAAVGTGQHKITATYSGDGAHGAGRGQTAITVTP